MNILYISISGNTRALTKHLTEYAEKTHAEDPVNPEVTLKEIHENSDFTRETEPLFTFVPTYLDDGNGLDSSDTETLTEATRKYLEHEDNHKLCPGAAGSGNKNFNNQYCLAAKQYAQRLGSPFLADYELRGISSDVTRAYQVLAEKNR